MAATGGGGEWVSYHTWVQPRGEVQERRGVRWMVGGRKMSIAKRIRGRIQELSKK